MSWEVCHCHSQALYYGDAGTFGNIVVTKQAAALYRSAVVFTG